MWIVLVVVIAAFAGGGVYLFSVRSLGDAADAASSSEHPESSASDAPATQPAAAAVSATTPTITTAAGPGAPPDAAPEGRRFLRRAKTDADPGQWKGVQPKGERSPETYIYVPLSIDEPPDVVTRLAKLLVLLALVSVSGLLVALGLWQLGQVIGRAIQSYFVGG